MSQTPEEVRQQKIEAALESWSWVVRYKAQTKDIALLGPMEKLIDQLADLAGITLPDIDPATRTIIIPDNTPDAGDSSTL